MNEEEVTALMRSSKNGQEWDDNATKVKVACGGYPAFWYKSIILSGLADETLGQGASEIKIITVPA